MRSSACSTTRRPRRPCSTPRSLPCSKKPPTPERIGRHFVSHHISGPRAVAEPIADITDLYAFPSPERPGHLVLVLNTLPFASPAARFSDALVYRFRLRELDSGPPGAPAPFTPAGDDDLVIDCVFSTAEDGGE